MDTCPNCQSHDVRVLRVSTGQPRVRGLVAWFSHVFSIGLNIGRTPMESRGRAVQTVNKFACRNCGYEWE